MDSGFSGVDRLRVGCCKVSRGEKMLYSGTDPESYITEYSLVYEDKRFGKRLTPVEAFTLHGTNPGWI